MKKNKPVIGYFIPEFPSQTHIFFWREFLSIRSAGRGIQMVSTRKADLSLVKHDFAQTASKQTIYLHPPSIAAIWFILTNIKWAAKSIGYVKKLKQGGIKEKLKNLYFILLAARLLEQCRKIGVYHVHGHSCASVAHILAIASICEEITYSLTLHGGLDVYGSNHKQKMSNAKFVAAVTRPLQQELHQQVGLPLEKIPVISMGVNLEKFQFNSTSKPPDEPLVFVTVARLTAGKGHTFALFPTRH